MSAEAAITFFVVIFIFGITPGPGVFAILARSMVFGARSCFMLALGMTISDIIYLVMACMGLAVIAEHWGEVFTVIRWVGAAYLFYLGYKLFTSKPDLEADPALQQGRTGLMGFVQGFLISASNPKVILFYIAFLPSFMDLSALSHQDVALAAGLTLCALMLGLMMIAGFTSWARRLLKTPTAAQRMNQGAGGIMMAAGTYLALHRP